MVRVILLFSRPRRSILFASWGAEEFGQVGSTEWVERHLPQVSSRVVAVINSEACVSGPDLEAEVSAPHLGAILEEAMKGVPSPETGKSQDDDYGEEENESNGKERSYYDYWKVNSGRGGDEFGDYLGMGGQVKVSSSSFWILI